MSNFTHIPRFGPRDNFGRSANSRQAPKYKVRKRPSTTAMNNIRDEAVRTIYDRSDRNYMQRGYAQKAREYSPGRVTQGRVTRKAGLFRNSKESYLVMNNLPSTVRRHVTNELAEIVGPDDSVEYVRPPIDEFVRPREGRHFGDRNCHDVPNYRTSQDALKDRRHIYNNYPQPIQRPHYFNQPRPAYNENWRREESWRCDHYRGDWKSNFEPQREDKRHYGEQKRLHINYDRPCNGYQRYYHDNDHEHERHRQKQGFRRPEPRRTRKDDWEEELQRKRKLPGLFTTLERESRRPLEPSADLPSMFAKGYRPLIQARRTQESPMENSTLSDQSYWYSTQDSGNESREQSTWPNSSSERNLSTLERIHRRGLESPEQERLEPSIPYPSKVLATRILLAMPKISLKDDENNRYGTTARALLRSSIRASEEEANGHSVTMQDLLNRTAALDFNSMTQDVRNGDIANENLFQPEQPSFMQNVHRASSSTPERERQFNRTINEGFHQDENYHVDNVEDFYSADQNPTSDVNHNDFNVTNWMGANWHPDEPNVPNSPADENFLRELDELVKPRAEEMNFNISGSFF